MVVASSPKGMHVASGERKESGGSIISATNGDPSGRKSRRPHPQPTRFLFHPKEPARTQRSAGGTATQLKGKKDGGGGSLGTQHQKGPGYSRSKIEIIHARPGYRKEELFQDVPSFFGVLLRGAMARGGSEDS